MCRQAHHISIALVFINKIFWRPSPCYFTSGLLKRINPLYTVCQNETKTTFSCLLFHLRCKCSAQAVCWAWKNYGHTMLMTAGGKLRVWIQMTSVVRSTTHLQRVPVSITSEPLQQPLTGQWGSTIFNLLKARPAKALENVLYGERDLCRQGQGWGDLMQKNFSVSDFHDSLIYTHKWWVWGTSEHQTNSITRDEVHRTEGEHANWNEETTIKTNQ